MDTVMQTDVPATIVQGPRQRSAQWGDLMTALAKAQGEIGGAKKDSINPAFKQPGKPEGSKYADLASVWDAIREPLSKNGLAVMQWPRVVEGAVEIETIVAHGEQFISDVLWMPCSKMDAHGIGSAITYGRRYALMAVAGVAPEDDDGNGAVDGHKPGAPGSAGGGGQFRPARRSPGMAQTESLRVDPRDHDMVQGDGRSQYEADKAKKTSTGPLGGREATAEEAIATKITNAVNKRIDALKRGSPWTRDGLDQFWAGDKKWIDWMSDPNNKQLKEYERFTNAFADAEVNIRPVELA